MAFRKLVLDVCDDHGALLRSHEDPERCSALAKSAMFVGPEDAESLDIGNFGLILFDEDRQWHRKLAMVDAAGTELSSLYFLETGHQLPEDVRKLAAANLAQGLTRFGLQVPEELAEIAGGTDPGIPIVNMQGRSLPEFHKKANPEEPGLDKIAEALQEFVDGGWKPLHPRHRRELALELIKHAGPMGLDVSRVEETFGGSDYGNIVEMGVRMRYKSLPTPDAEAHYELLLGKQASLDPDQFAGTLASMDETCGIDTLWDKIFPDPYTTTFFTETSPLVKQAAPDLEDEVVTSTGQRASKRALLELAKEGSPLDEKFDPPFMQSYRMDPVGTFQHIPTPLQQIIAQAAGA